MSFAEGQRQNVQNLEIEPPAKPHTPSQVLKLTAGSVRNKGLGYSREHGNML